MAESRASYPIYSRYNELLADPYPKKGGKQGSEPQESQDVGGESQDVRGGHPKPQGDHTGEPRKEQTVSLDRTELCVSCNKKADDDAIECQWCSRWEHKVCAKISSEQYLLLDSTPLNIMFFCSSCASRVPQALTIVDRFQVFENNIVSVVKKSIASQFTTSYESTQLNNAYHKLQKSVDEMSTRINNLSQQNNNLQMEIDTASESLSSSVESRPVLSTVLPSSAAMSIADELADRERRKNNIIVYNFPEASDHQSDKDSFADFCNSVFKHNGNVNRMLRLGKKVPNKHRPLLLGFENYEHKGLLLSRAHLLRHSDQYNDVFIAPDRTKFEREKYRKLVVELKERRSIGVNLA